MLLGKGIEHFPEEFKERFDLVTASGTWSKGHIPKSGFDDIHCAMKPNGYAVTSMRSLYWIEGEPEGYYDKVQAMIRESKFRLIHTEQFMRGYKGGEGLMATMPCTAVVLQKI